MRKRGEENAKKLAVHSATALYRLFRLFLLLGISYIVLYPIITMLLESLTTPSDLFSSSHMWIPDHPTFENYRTWTGYFAYAKHAKITLEISVISTALQLIVCSLTGYGLARYRFRGNFLVFIMVILTIIVPIQTAQIPQYQDYQRFDFFGLGRLIGLFTGKPLTVNLLGTNWVVFIPAMLGVGVNAGLYIFLFRQFFKGLPSELEDAGRIDGCNALQTFLRVMAPNTIPVFVTVALLSMIFYWNDTLISNMYLNLDDAMPLMLYVEKMTDPQVASALGLSPEQYKAQTYVSLLTAVSPLTLVYIFCQNFFTACIDRSGIKG